MDRRILSRISQAIPRSKSPGLLSIANVDLSQSVKSYAVGMESKCKETSEDIVGWVSLAAESSRAGYRQFLIAKEVVRVGLMIRENNNDHIPQPI